MRYDREHKARTREKVLDEAAALVREAGPGGLGIGAVMARAGLTHGGFYAHFTSRDELLAETISHMVSRRATVLTDTLGDPDPRRAVRRYVRGYLSWAHCEGAAGGCPLPLLAGEASHLPGPARAHYALGFETMVEAFAGALARLGVDAARIAVLAPTVVVEMIGALAVARSLPSQAQAEALLATVRASVIDKLGVAAAPRPAPDA